jgi:hypothetical protein
MMTIERAPIFPPPPVCAVRFAVSVLNLFPVLRQIRRTLTTRAISGGKEAMKDILQYLKTHGERLDTEIAAALGLSLATARTRLSQLAADREVMVCHSIRYEQGRQIEGIKCRLAGFIPPAAPGRKSKSQLKIS